jgi:hypothetical protein
MIEDARVPLRPRLAIFILSSLATEGDFYLVRPASDRRKRKSLEEETRMFAMTRSRLLVALIVTSALAALLALAALPPAAKADHSWGSYHWARTANPFTVQLGDNVSPTWDPYLRTTSSDWSKSSVLDTPLATGQAGTKSCHPKSGRVEVCNGAYGNNGWLGLAQIWVSGTHITQGATKVNDTYFNTPQYDTSAWRNLVMCQEVGHTLGLDHQDEDFDNRNLGTCMDYTSNPTTNQHPNQHDYDELEIIYSHLDSTTTVGSASVASKARAAASQGNLNSRSEWGRKVRESRNGKLEVWVHGFGNGNKVFTFVIEA